MSSGVDPRPMHGSLWTSDACEPRGPPLVPQDTRVRRSEIRAPACRGGEKAEDACGEPGYSMATARDAWMSGSVTADLATPWRAVLLCRFVRAGGPR